MIVSRLSDLQTEFCEFLVHGWHEDRIAAQLRPPGQSQAVQRLDIYRNGYFIRLEKALAHDFPVSEKVMGQVAFAQMAGEYVLANPSQHPNLRKLGHGFADWLRVHAGAATANLADIEWAVMQVFDGPNAAPVDPNRLQSFSPADWPGLEITLLPTLTLLQLSSNADRVWLAKGEKIELNKASPRQLAIGRDESFRPLFTELDSDTFAVLAALAHEPRLAVASEKLAEQGDTATVPQRIAQSMHQALARGWVATIELTVI